MIILQILIEVNASFFSFTAGLLFLYLIFIDDQLFNSII